MTTTGTRVGPAREQQARSLWIRLGGAFTVLALLVAGIYVWAWMTRGETSSGHTYQAGPATRLTISADVGGLSLVPGAPGRIVVNTHVTWELARPRIRQSYQDGTLTISIGCGSTLLGWCDTSADVAVPPGMAVNAGLRTGNLRSSGLTGALTLRSDTGDVTVWDSQGPVSVTSTTGNVTLVQSSSGSVRATSATGEVSLTFARPPSLVDASSTTGDVHVRVPPTPSGYAVSRSSGGSARGTVADSPQSPDHITARSTTSDVAVDYD
jgi:hypothetical protein